MRENPDFCIIARTDAMVSYGREEAVRRANKYLEAGADAVFVVGCSTLEEVGMVAREVSGPVVVNVNDISERNRYSQETFCKRCKPVQPVRRIPVFIEVLHRVQRLL